MVASGFVVCCERASGRRIAVAVGGDGGETLGPKLVDRVVPGGELVEAIIVFTYLEERFDALALEGISEQFAPGAAISTERVVDVK